MRRSADSSGRHAFRILFRTPRRLAQGNTIQMASRNLDCRPSRYSRTSWRGVVLRTREMRQVRDAGHFGRHANVRMWRAIRLRFDEIRKSSIRCRLTALHDWHTIQGRRTALSFCTVRAATAAIHEKFAATASDVQPAERPLLLLREVARAIWGARRLCSRPPHTAAKPLARRSRLPRLRQSRSNLLGLQRRKT